MPTKQRITKRLVELEAEIRKRYNDFWEHFSDDELEALARNEPKAIRALLENPEWSELSRLYDAIMTPEERVEITRITNELAKELNIPNGEQ